jgi:hypothetical protein
MKLLQVINRKARIYVKRERALSREELMGMKLTSGFLAPRTLGFLRSVEIETFGELIDQSKKEEGLLDIPGIGPIAYLGIHLVVNQINSQFPPEQH